LHWQRITRYRRYGHARFFYNPYFSVYFFNENSVSLSQQISQISVSACFFNEANRALVVLIDFRCHQLLVPALSMPCHHLLNTLVLAHTTSLYKLIGYNPGLLVYPAGSWKREKDCDANATREGETVIPIATRRPTTWRDE